MIRPTRAWSLVGQRIAVPLPFKPNNALEKGGTRMKNTMDSWNIQARRYESTSSHSTSGQQKAANPTSFTPQIPRMPDPESLPPLGGTTTSSDSIPIPSMPPPPAAIPPRKTQAPSPAPQIPSSPPAGVQVAGVGREEQAGARFQRELGRPNWKNIFLEPIYTPLRAYGAVHKRRPYLTQFVSAVVIYFLGDMVAQSIGGVNDHKHAERGEQEGEDERPGIQAWAEDRDWWRTARALVIGGVASIPGFKWFVWLSNSFNYRSRVGSLSVKVLVNQTLFTPIFNTYFFAMQSLLNLPTPSPQQLYEHISNTVPRSCYNSCKIWPAVTAFSFAFVRLEYRSLVAGVVAIGWQTYLSLLDSRVRRAERERHGLEGGEETGMVVEREVDKGSAGAGEKCTA